MKKNIILITAIIMLLLNYATLVIAANNVPYEFWNLSKKYSNALEEQNYTNIIQYGNEIIGLFEGKEENQTYLNIVTPRLEQIAKAYEAIGDFENAVKTFNLYIPLAKKQGWDDGVIYAQSKISALDFDIELYTINNNIKDNLFYGGKYEPLAGIYFGSTYDNDENIGTFNWDIIKNYYPKKNSAYLIYLDWEEKISDYERYFVDAKKNDIGVQIAWNIYTSEDIYNIKDEYSYIKSTATYLKNLGIPIFLRFACEMNISEIGDSSTDYIEAFRYVSNIIKEYAPNVAMVWSPNEISAEGRTYEEYYPGDEYVDWVGLSSYNFLYFQGKKDWGNMQDTIDSVYFSGDYVNPIKKLETFIKNFGINKPVMISETGVGHYAKLEEEDLTDWAKIQLRRLYVYGPIVYPQLKGIFYFNADNDIISPYNDYALYNNIEFRDLYNKLVNSKYYISKVDENASYRYEKILDYKSINKNMLIMTYAIPPKVLEPTVKYFIDDKEVLTRTELPYETYFNFNNYNVGKHKLTVKIYDGNKLIKLKNYSLLIEENCVEITDIENENSSIGNISDLPLEIQKRLDNLLMLFIGNSKTYSNNVVTYVDTNNMDVKPFVENGRTLVPVRYISEAFGANVKWKESSSTVTVIFDNTEIKLKLNSNVMYVNGNEVIIDVAANIYDGRTFIPLRALAETLGKKVFYSRGLIIISDINNIFDIEKDEIIVDKLISLFN